MPKSSFKSNTIFSESSNVNVDRENSIVKNIVIVQQGENKNNSYFNSKFISDIVESGNAQSQGVKSRFGHPNACATTLGSYVGRYKNFTQKEGKAYADLHLDPITQKTQVEGKGITMHEYILDMAESNPDMFGNSIVIMGETFQEFNTNGDIVHEKSFKLESFLASDLVDDPAATNALFNNSNDLGVVVSDFLDNNPAIFSTIQKDPKVLIDFMGRYSDYLNKFKNNDKMSFFKKISNMFSNEEEHTFDIEETTANGEIIKIITEGETPQEGDEVQGEDGSDVEDGDITIKDGSVWTIEGGKISVIAPAPASEEEEEEEEEDSEPTIQEVMQSVNSLASAFESFKTQYSTDNNDNQKAVQHIAEKVQVLSRSVKSTAPEYKKQEKEFKNNSTSSYDSDAVREARKNKKD